MPTASRIGEPTRHTSSARRNSGKELTDALLWLPMAGKGSWRRGGTCVKRLMSVGGHVPWSVRRNRARNVFSSVRWNSRTD